MPTGRDRPDDLLDVLAGALVLGHRAAVLAQSPARWWYRSPLGAPARALTASLRERGAAVRPRWQDGARQQFESALQRLLTSAWAEQLVRDALAQPRFAQLLAEAAGSTAMRETAERVVRDVVTGAPTQQLVGELLATPSLQADLQRLLLSPELEAFVVALLEDPQIDRWVLEATRSSRLEELLVPVLESPALLSLTDRVLVSEEMQRVLRTIAASPEIRTALAEQSMGLAEELTGEVRERSVTLDDVLEERVRGWLRRPRPRGAEQ